MSTLLGFIFVLILVLGFFIGVGMAVASIFCKERNQMLLVGTLIGIGLLFVAGGIIYAGCSKMGNI
jgi:hypothetical protein